MSASGYALHSVCLQLSISFLFYWRPTAISANGAFARFAPATLLHCDQWFGYNQSANHIDPVTVTRDGLAVGRQTDRQAGKVDTSIDQLSLLCQALPTHSTWPPLDLTSLARLLRPSVISPSSLAGFCLCAGDSQLHRLFCVIRLNVKHDDQISERKYLRKSMSYAVLFSMLHSDDIRRSGRVEAGFQNVR